MQNNLYKLTKLKNVKSGKNYLDEQWPSITWMYVCGNGGRNVIQRHSNRIVYRNGNRFYFNRICKVIFRKGNKSKQLNFIIMKNTELRHRSNLFLLFICCLTISASQAQESSTKNHVYGGVGYFMAGYTVVDLDNVNQSFKTAGYPELKNSAFSLGGGGHFIFNNLIIGGEGHGVIGNTAENNLYKTAHSSGYGFFNLGYVAYNSPSFNIYPLVGFGGGGMTVYMFEKSNLTNSFDAILSDPGRETYITNGGFLMNFSLGADYFIAGEKSGSNTGGFMIGLKAGYILDISNKEWDFNGQKLSDGQNGSVAGPYIRIVIGGGGISRNK